MANDEYATDNENETQVKSILSLTKNKIDILLLNNGWNDKNERLIISIGENAASYKWMHDKLHSKYKLHDKILSLITIMVSAVLSIQTIYYEETKCINDNQANNNLVIVKNTLIYSVTLLSIINNFLKYQELSIKHINASVQYSEMYHDIQQQMCMYRKDRNNAVKYIHNMLKKSDNIKISSPDIDKDVLSEFKKKFQNADIAIPDIADKIQKIDIITEPRVNSSSSSDNTGMFYLKNNNNNDNNNNNNNKDDSENSYDNRPKQLTNLHNMNSYNTSSLKINGDLDDNDGDLLQDYLKRRALEAQTNFEYQRTFNPF